MIEFLDADGRRWRVQLISHGRTSGYLNPRVHRPVLQFTCVDRRLPRRYAAYSESDAGPLADRSETELQGLLRRAASH